MNKGENVKSGYVAVVGRPNVGKSSLVNALVGQKVSIVGPKPQTTRNKILGIKNTENEQIVFVDTPGTTSRKDPMGAFLVHNIRSGLVGADLILVVVDGNKINEGDFELLNDLTKKNIPIILAINKMDLFKFEKIYPKLKKINSENFKAIVNISAKTGQNLDILDREIKNLLPEGQPFFDRDSITDKTERFLVAELIREKALLYLQEEIPHGLAIEISKFLEDENIVHIDADIIVNKKRHKNIVIGKNGEMLKKIGTSARKEIEKLLGKNVFLSCFVRVEENWIDSISQMRNIGYDIKNI